MQRLATFPLALLMTAAFLPFAPARAQPAGFSVERPQSQVHPAPPGSVGRKTTDTSRYVGNTEETEGDTIDYSLTFGGFAKECPSAAGFVDGDFEYTIAYNAVTRGADGVTRTEQNVRRMIASMKGEVDDQAKLVAVELSGTFTITHTGDGIVPQNESRSVQRRFVPGPSGEPDFPAMEAAVLMTADIAVASVILQAGWMYRTAELVWMAPNKCAEMTFDPPTDTVAMRPNEEREVKATVTSKGDGSAVRWTTDNVNPLIEGRVTPTKVPDALAATVPFKYTSSARPRVRHGFSVIARSRAGIASGEWRIVDQYEGTFTQVDAAETAVSVVSGQTNDTVTGRLVWTYDPTPRPKSFGADMPTAFYKATDGELTVEHSQNSRGAGGSNCEGTGRQTYQLNALAESKRQYLLLEIAGDGRYKLTLGLLDYPQDVWNFDVTCNFPGGRSVTQSTPAMLPAVVIGVQQGTLTPERGVVGEMPPQQRGPLRTTGKWEFKLVE